MWLEYPEVGGSSAKVDVSYKPDDASVFRLHSAAVNSGDMKWVGASGLRGASSVVIDIERNGQYQVKLHFMEPDEVGVGKRVFDVSLQGKTVLRELDVARVAGGSRKAIVREFFVAVSDQELRIELAPKGERSAVISGVEWHEIP